MGQLREAGPLRQAVNTIGFSCLRPPASANLAAILWVRGSCSNHGADLLNTFRLAGYSCLASSSCWIGIPDGKHDHRVSGDE